MSMESRIAQRWAGTEKTSRLLKRHIKILEKYLDSRNLKGWEQIDYDSLPWQVQDALDRVKAGESLWSDVNRWINDYMLDRRYHRRASEKKAMNKNRRVFVDFKGYSQNHIVIFDFRADTGYGFLQTKELLKRERVFLRNVKDAFPVAFHGVEVWNNQLTFRAQSEFIRLDELLKNPKLFAGSAAWDVYDGEWPSEELIREGIAEALKYMGWRVTFK